MMELFWRQTNKHHPDESEDLLQSVYLQELDESREQNRQLYRDKLHAVEEARESLEEEKERQLVIVTEQVERVITTVSIWLLFLSEDFLYEILLI